MQQSKNAFTMLEVVFVIVIIGILSAIAIPKFAVTRQDAQIAKARADIASIRSAIVTERQSRLIQGDSNWTAGLDTSFTILFNGDDGNESHSTLLMYGIAPGYSSGQWSATDSTHYTFHISSIDVNFTYSEGIFTCTTGTDTAGEMCKKLIN